jgi:phage terminase large subunit
VAPFWATKLEDERDDVAVIHATYKDNPFVEASIIKALELRAKTDPNFYRVFVLGKYGSLEGVIFTEGTNWSKVDAMPEEPKRRLFVVDYGFTHDPTFVGELAYSNGEFWVDELVYKPGMFNTEIHDVIGGFCRTEVQRRIAFVWVERHCFGQGAGFGQVRNPNHEGIQNQCDQVFVERH